MMPKLSSEDRDRGRRGALCGQKDLSRKRVRIPDLVCLRVRNESRVPRENQSRFVDVSQSNGRGAGMGLWHG